jgi:hypothetical protein
MTVKRDAVMHAAFRRRRFPVVPASHLFPDRRACPASRHESADAAIRTGELLFPATGEIIL